MGNFGDYFLKTSPQYVQGFEDGFEAAQKASTKRIRAILKEIEKLEAYSDYTSTTTLEIPDEINKIKE